MPRNARIVVPGVPYHVTQRGSRRIEIGDGEIGDGAQFLSFYATLGENPRILDVPRNARIVVPGVPYHVTQRGSRRGDVFFNSNDRIFYLNLLAEYTLKHGVEVLDYCLMTNHVHHILVASDESGLYKVLRPVHSRYARQVNRQHGWTGHLWESRFFSCALDERHLRTALRYVELNPVRAGIVEKAELYPWSGARARVSGTADPVLTTQQHWLDLLATYTDNWSEWLSSGITPGEIKLLRNKTKQGLPFGGSEFIELLEKITGKSHRHGRPGRPPKARKK